MKIKGMLLGLAIGDAIGVPVEFETRSVLNQDPVVDMRGFGTYAVPMGTFSDDTSMSWCLAETILEGYSPNLLADKFVDWRFNNKYTASGITFDCGVVTNRCIEKYAKSGKLTNGSNNESENGNGSLMRIAPLIILLKGKKIEERYELVKEVSSITHAHIRSVLSCFFLCELMLEMLNGSDKQKSYIVAQNKIKHIFKIKNISRYEQSIFEKIYPNNIWLFSEQEIVSSGYVIHTLEASLWAFYTTTNYKDAVLKAVNLGEDTDTTAAITGSIAGLYYGYDKIPNEWLDILLKKDELIKLSNDLQLKFLF